MRKLIVYIDGGSRGNPGPAALGVVVCNEKGEAVKRYSEYLGELTNNQAEYYALIFAFKKIKLLFGKKITSQQELEVRSDSELLVKQLKGEYKVLEPEIQKLFLEAWNLKLDFAKVRVNLISRQKNKEADRLVNEALDGQAKNQNLF
jgi:ribonuclease HI